MTSQQIREKSSARKVLAVLVGLLASLLALEGLATVRSGGPFEVFAQQTGTAPTIKLINPDTTTSNQISAKNDTEDTTYHLVAWVANPPTSPVVQFKYNPSGDTTPEINIVCADTGTVNARAATADTYECDWNLSGVDDGGGVLRAELYSEGTGKVAEDEESVTIDKEGQTVEIVYPRQGEQVGFYTGPDGVSSGMIDVKTSGPGTPEDDEGTQRVTVYYSIAPPGAEPDFQECGEEDVTGGSQESIRCDLAADDPDTTDNEAHRPSQVTAIAAVAGDTDESDIPNCTEPTVPVCDQPDTDSADAHRAIGYEQDPNAVSLDRQTQQVVLGQCSQTITATVTDQNGRIVVGVNVDVHAQGPFDNLFFDDDNATDDESSDSKPPEGHQVESGVNCEDTEPPPGNTAEVQGDHDRVDADIKHIESADDAGTDDEGKFSFRLYSTDAGATQFTVWADEDGDDNRCSGEATGIGSIGWNQAPPSPTGVDETAQPCPSPTGTGSPTSTPTQTQSPTNSPTTSPSTTAAPTQCSDGQDNDGDGDTDMQDEGCTDGQDDDESDDGQNEVENGPCAGYEEGSRNPQPNGGLIIVGTSGPDEIRGSGGDDIICALGGKDAVRGRGGDDSIYGAGGHDDLRGNAGNDLISGQGGIDVIRGGGGSDIANGGARNDTIRGYDGRDRLVGGGGDDTLRAGDGNDRVYGNKGADVLDGGPGRDLCRPGPGRDTKTRCERS